MADDMTTGLLTTNYNTSSMSTQCVEHCLRYADDTIDQFIIVDDHSTEEFNLPFENVKIIRNAVNLGLVKSLNVGLSSMNTDLIILFDSDAWPLENFILKTKEYFKNNPEVGIAAYQTVNADQQPTASFEAEPDAMSILLGQQLHAKYQKIFDKNPGRITVYTCAMVIRKEVLEQVGGFDENYDWLELDHDICMSASRKGWKIGVIPVKAFHKGSGTAQKVAHRVIRFYKNRIKLLRKFKKYPMEPLLNSIVIGRLSIEYLMINVVGRLKYSDEVRRDKSSSRTELIKLFISGKI